MFVEERIKEAVGVAAGYDGTDGRMLIVSASMTYNSNTATL